MEQRLRELRLQLLSKETSNLTHHEALERAEVEFPPPHFFFCSRRTAACSSRRPPLSPTPPFLQALRLLVQNTCLLVQKIKY